MRLSREPVVVVSEVHDDRLVQDICRDGAGRALYRRVTTRFGTPAISALGCPGHLHLRQSDIGPNGYPELEQLLEVFQKARAAFLNEKVPGMAGGDFAGVGLLGQARPRELAPRHRVPLTRGRIRRWCR
jgi:hypothetical protein